MELAENGIHQWVSAAATVCLLDESGELFDSCNRKIRNEVLDQSEAVDIVFKLFFGEDWRLEDVAQSQNEIVIRLPIAFAISLIPFS